MAEQQEWNWNEPFSLAFSLTDGLSPDHASTRRSLSAMHGMFADRNAYQSELSVSDPLVYEFYELGAPSDSGDLSFGTSITYPGKVGDEYYMTKGHFHTILETAEIYWCVCGKGMMLMENPEGDWQVTELTPGRAVHVPKRYAHRSINVGKEPFVTFFVFRADAGHDYGSIETEGFRKLVVERDGKPVVIDNSRWKRGGR